MRFTKYYQQFGWVSWRAIINSAVSERTEQTVFLDIGISENNNLPRHSSSIPLCPCSFSFASLPLLLDSSNHFLLPTVLPSYLPTDSPSDQ
jgi:hypothetical protein